VKASFLNRLLIEGAGFFFEKSNISTATAIGQLEHLCFTDGAIGDRMKPVAPPIANAG